VWTQSEDEVGPLLAYDPRHLARVAAQQQRLAERPVDPSLEPSQDACRNEGMAQPSVEREGRDHVERAFDLAENVHQTP
jgi:hypothetical protein